MCSKVYGNKNHSHRAHATFARPFPLLFLLYRKVVEQFMCSQETDFFFLFVVISNVLKKVEKMVSINKVQQGARGRIADL